LLGKAGMDAVGTIDLLAAGVIILMVVGVVYLANIINL
jgi:hypothetical protein